MLLSAYLSDETLCRIFGTDILNDESLQELLDQLTGSEEARPFECLGTSEEVNTAIAMSIRNHEAAGEPLPALYQRYRQSTAYEQYREKTTDWSSYNTENLVPEEYQRLLKQWIGEMKQ